VLVKVGQTVSQKVKGLAASKDYHLASPLAAMTADAKEVRSVGPKVVMKAAN